MKDFSKVLLCACLSCVCGMFGADAADRNTNRAGVNVARMPVMPILPINAVGNGATNTIMPNPNPNPNPNPDPTPKCPDGGVRDSEYTILNCMNDVYGCVQGGGLSGGIAAMYDSNTFNSIVNGMGLCRVQVEKCISDVRVNCRNIYNTFADVWLDFNSRKVRPEYYNFVLRKTGLTPSQAENVCALLDVNAYGKSFNAVSNSGVVTSEYNNNVGAYNNQNGGALSKDNPIGATVNYGDENTGVDGARGYYARWNPQTAECLLRVAAYNKDDLIYNSWLFGALGDDAPAEVWKKTGDSFKCGKDLFDFSLMNDTKTTAVVGVGGGSLVGAGIGAAVGHGDRAFSCANARNELAERIRQNGGARIVQDYLDDETDIASVSGCDALVDLYDRYKGVVNRVQLCKKQGSVYVPSITCDTNSKKWTLVESSYLNDAEIEKVKEVLNNCKKDCGTDAKDVCLESIKSVLDNNEITPDMCNIASLKKNEAKITCNVVDGGTCLGYDSSLLDNQLQDLKKVFGNAENEGSVADLIEHGEKGNRLKTTLVGTGIGMGLGGTATAIAAIIENKNINCRVGDGLATVSYGKSYTIDSLKDFYIKWNLNVGDDIPTTKVYDCDSWMSACRMMVDLNDCRNVQFNYQPNNKGEITLINTPCMVSGSVCIENRAVAVSNGACVASGTDAE